MRGGLAERSSPPGRPPLTALVVLGVRGRRREAGETVPKLRETCLQFRFRIFGIFGFLDLGGIPRRGAGRQGLAARTLVPFARRGRTSAPGRPRFVSLPPAGARASVWDSRPAPGAGPGDRGPCAAPSAPAAPPSLGVGTVPESGPVAAALRLLPSPALAPWPGRPGDRSACLHQANGSRFHPVGLRKRENRLKFDPFLRKAVRRGRRESGRGEGPSWPEALVARLPLQIDLLHSPPKRSICTHATSSLP